MTGLLDENTLTERQKGILNGVVRDLTDDEIEWFDENGMAVVFDSIREVGGAEESESHFVHQLLRRCLRKTISPSFSSKTPRTFFTKR